MTGSLLARVRALLVQAVDSARTTSAEAPLRAAAARLDEPLRVAIAGKVKAGKSTLLNALVGEELAPTGTGECTTIVTWYRNGPTYRVTLHPRGGGAPRQVPFSHGTGAIEVDLGGTPAGDVERLEVEWPSASLRAMTLIDTPGMASLSAEVSARTVAFLAPGDEEVSPADAVVYLLRHLHATDVRILEAFHEDDSAGAVPVNAVGVLSRADEVAVGRLDGMESAARVAERYRRDPKVRRLCQTVVPVAGLLARSGSTLREAEFAALAELARAPRDDVEALLLSADRFAAASTPVPLSDGQRRQLLERLGLFGVRLSVALVRDGGVADAPTLAAELVRRSGIVELRQVLTAQFAGRRDVLKSRSALLTLDAVLRQHPLPGAASLAAQAEQIAAGAHELAELSLAAALRAGVVRLRPDELESLDLLLGSAGMSPAARLGLPPEAGPDELRAALEAAVGRWHRRAENPLSSREVAYASQVAQRTCEGLLASVA